MRIIQLLSVSLSCGALAQPTAGTGGIIRPLADRLFESCEQVKNRAVGLAGDIAKPVYFIQLYPENETLYYPFPSDQSTVVKFRWLGQHDPRRHPYALFYFVRGAYSFRCRDRGDQYTESSGTLLQSTAQKSDPLLLELTTGTAKIWHFWASDTNMDTVLVVTETPLDKLDGEEVLAKIRDQLGARFTFAYVRNDPWFFGYVQDSIPFVFADSFHRITESEYQATPTMVCYTNQGCKVRQSLFE